MLLLLAVATAYVGSRACAPCHEALYQTYCKTGMARSSGDIGGELPEGTVRHAASSMVYRMASRAGTPFFEYSSLTDARMNGRQAIGAFIGSGTIGRSYLFRIEDWWFLAPVSYFSQRGSWDISPGYEADRSMHFNRRVTESCLYCHATGARAAPGTYNQFSDPPWTEAGVGCERCHGPGEGHVKRHEPILNPAKLTAERRDSVCAQCHLTGEERIERPGKSLAMFRSGDHLSEYADYFVMAGSGMRATSHVERLAASVCKQRAGERMWCGTCHDPHASPSPPERAGFYRAKCLGCHEVQVCGRGADCAGCHMPRATVIDAGHSILTDHSIPRSARRQPAAPSGELVRFGGGQTSFRSLGLAYANLAIRTGERRHLERAISLLRQADPKDAAVLAQLGRSEELLGRSESANELYESALSSDPKHIVSAVNLGVLVARHGDLQRAMALWKDVFDRDPATTEAGINLAIAFSRRGQEAEARAILLRVLRFDPTSGPAHKLLDQNTGTIKP